MDVSPFWAFVELSIGQFTRHEIALIDCLAISGSDSHEFSSSPSRGSVGAMTTPDSAALCLALFRVPHRLASPIASTIVCNCKLVKPFACNNPKSRLTTTGSWSSAYCRAYRAGEVACCPATGTVFESLRAYFSFHACSHFTPSASAGNQPHLIPKVAQPSRACEDRGGRFGRSPPSLESKLKYSRFERQIIGQSSRLRELTYREPDFGPGHGTLTTNHVARL